MKTTTHQMPVQFFYENAGFSYDPATESEEDGKYRCARQLAEAEANGSTAGLSFEWTQDVETDESFRDTDEPYFLWCCTCCSQDGEVLASLGGVDFGPESDPWAHKYRRVVEAELAAEALSL